MGESYELVERGTFEVINAPGGVFAAAVRGFVSFTVLGDVLAAASRALASSPEVRSVLLDVESIAGFEPGVPARLIQWLGAHTEQVTGLVVVSSRPVLQAVVRAAEVMLPGVICVSATMRSEGLAVAGTLAQRRRRSYTGSRRRSGSGGPAEARKNTA